MKFFRSSVLLQEKKKFFVFSLSLSSHFPRSLFRFLIGESFFFFFVVSTLPLLSPNHGQGQGSPPGPLVRGPVQELPQAGALGHQEEERRQAARAPQKGCQGGRRGQGKREKKGCKEVLSGSFFCWSSASVVARRNSASLSPFCGREKRRRERWEAAASSRERGER